MKAVQIDDYSGPEGLKEVSLEKPIVGSDEVLVKVKIAAVNPVDYKIASGMRKAVFPIELPWIPGKDFSGVIESVGNNIKDFKPGQEVFGSASGAYAEYLVAPTNMIAPKPKDLGFTEASSLPVAGLTAWQCLFDHGHLEPHQSVLIHGAAGGVGTFAVQLARWKGAKVIATGSSNNKDYLYSLGINEFIDYKNQDFAKLVKNVDLVVDLIAGETQKRSFQVIKEGGYLVSTLEAPPEEELKKYKIRGGAMRMQVSTKALEELAQVVVSSKMKILISKTYPLSKVKEAWEQIISGHTQGKIVLEI